MIVRVTATKRRKALKGMGYDIDMWYIQFIHGTGISYACIDIYIAKERRLTQSSELSYAAFLLSALLCLAWPFPFLSFARSLRIRYTNTTKTVGALAACPWHGSFSFFSWCSFFRSSFPSLSYIYPECAAHDDRTLAYVVYNLNLSLLWGFRAKKTSWCWSLGWSEHSVCI